MPPICITTGDPAGIGPEVTFKALRKLQQHPGIIIFMHPQLLDAAKRGLSIQKYDGTVHKNEIKYMPIGQAHAIQQAPNDATNAQIAYEALTEAIKICKKSHAPLVTAPISKAGFLAANIPYTGHTTLLQDAFNSPNASMAFYSNDLKIILGTIHIPLSDVETALTPERLHTTIQNAQQFATNIGISNPKIAMAGLNPHASENGQFGSFENNTLIPIIHDYSDTNITLQGPISPDVVFRDAHEGKHDIVIALYHDQGLIPLKLLAFDSAVNVTIGLPICRTSPDHGTAYDIANKNIANPNAMLAAIQYAIKYTP